MPPLVEGMADFRPLALPRLRELAAEPISTISGLHARFALLPDEPHRITELLDYARTCRAAELALFTRLPIAATVEHAPALWADLTDPRTTAPKRLRIAAVLAAVAPTDPRWTALAPTLADQLVRVTPLEAEAFVRAFTQSGFSARLISHQLSLIHI